MVRAGACSSAWFVLAFVALGLASPASAATIGQIPPVDPPTTTCGNTFDQLQPTVTGGTSYVVPSTDGIANWTVTSWSTKSSSPGESMTLKMFRKAGDPDVYKAIAHEGPHSLVAGVNTFPAHLEVQAGDVLGVNSTPGSCVFPVPGEHFLYFLGNLADGQQASFTPDTDFRVNASAQVEPTSDITLGKAKSKSNGTAVLPVTVENPGVLAASGGGAAKASSPDAVFAKQIAAAGTVKLKIKAKGLSKRKLARKGKVTVNPKITFTPTGGIPNSVFRKIKLHRASR